MKRGSERRTAAVVAADVVGYSRKMGEDESGTLEALRQTNKSDMLKSPIPAC